MSIDLIKTLYYTKELSTIEIADRLDVTPWVIIRFMRKMNLPRRTPREANAKRFERKPITFSLRQNLSNKEKELKTAGIMLYWAEGCRANPVKRMWTIDFANSNPRMIEVFLKFLRQICGIEEKRLRVYLYCYSNQNIEAIKKYWQKITNIPAAQFTKPYIRNDFLLEKSGKMKYGLVHIRYCDKKLLLQIEEWIENYVKMCKI